ncbi:helix-turn-helix domain-containing protein [Nocardioides albidus]|uniref:Helix-turn-helix domain-containing protein n=1 Tax=Nocardioides albidus TaxID=1517589 RepID=A0A5C4VTZ9_9ACTN|nr:helix-turn-helix domain-containing protein [Nocardioides albidus]TNM39434.1 helix-turn-helix domain-containing protein [Nocardioides albidus]
MSETTDTTGSPRIEVRRNVSLSATVAGFAALLTIAFAVRAFGGGTTLDWLSFGVLILVTVAHLAALVDGRAPLLVADEHGVRLRHGATWRGIAWPEIDCLEHLPRRGLVRDGHILVDGYDDQQLVVPLTLATRVVGVDTGSLSDVLAELADGRADVVEVVPEMAETSEEAPERDDAVPHLSDLHTEETPPAPPVRRGIAARVAGGLSGGDAVHPRTDAADFEDTGEVVLSGDTESTDEIDAVEDDEPPAPDRPTLRAARVEWERPALVRGPAETSVPADTGSVTVVLEDLAVRPAAQPVIGPELTAARDRLRLTIDQLSERTRIRPHVIEAMEVDDFAPCGGDFYARGHLRTLARVLGIDAGPLVAAYDDTYADAPVDPRRVFEAELATAAGGGIRSTRGGRNWSVIVAAVMGVVLVWSVAQLVMGGPEPVSDTPVLNQSGGISKAAAAKGDPVKVTLVAAGGGAQLVIRDAAGEIVFDGDLAFGQTSELKVVPPVRIWSSDGSVTYAIGGKKAQALGETGAEVSKTLLAP